jgi:Phage integrase, N-terminal SAM-like domain
VPRSGAALLLKKHIAPYLGGVPIGKLSTAMIREWRAKLLGKVVPVSVAAKAYRLLRAVLMTAVEQDTRIELALSAWEAQRLRLPGTLTWRPWRSRVTWLTPCHPG